MSAENATLEAESKTVETASGETISEATNDALDALDIVDPEDLKADEAEDTKTTDDKDDSPEEKFESLAESGEDESTTDESKGGDDSKADETVGVDERIISAGRAFGMSRAQLEKMGNDSATEMVMWAVQEREKAELSKSAGVKKEAESEEAEFKPFKLDIGEDDDVAAPIAEQFKKMNDHYAEQFEAMQSKHRQDTDSRAQEHDAMVKHINAQSSASYESRFDTFMSELGPDFEADLGKGATASLERSSSEYKARVKVDDLATVIEAGYKALGHEPPDERSRLMTAVRGTLGNKTETRARRAVEGKVKKRSTQILERPGSRERSPNASTTHKQSVSVIAAKMKELGMDIDDD